MTEQKRRMKRIKIGIVYLILFSLFVWMMYRIIRPAPTCFDGKQNQNEAGIDCGGVCAKVCDEVIIAAPLAVTESSIMQSGPDRYDVLIKVHNPNDVFGASDFRYTVSLVDALGNVLATQSGNDFIFPQDTKYVLSFNFSSTTKPATAKFSVSDVTWQRFSGYKEQPPLPVYAKHYAELRSDVFAEATGSVKNESLSDFRSVMVKVILRDASSRALAINRTALGNLRTGELRDFRLTFPSAFLGVVTNVETEAETDLYSTSNLIKQSLQEEQNAAQTTTSGRQ